MGRRHLFDNGYPVSAATLLAGSEVLLAVSRRSLERSRYRQAISFLFLANAGERVVQALAREGCTRITLSDSRQNYAKLATYAQVVSGGEESARDPREEPQDHAACARPDQH
jgi:hypothetical protein